FCDGERDVFDMFPTGGAARWKAVSTARDHACAVTMDGLLFCWGMNFAGKLGTGDTDAHLAPTRVGDESDWTAVAAGGSHTCGLRAGGLWCWGANNVGQLGDDLAETQIAFPKRIGTSSTWTAIVAGDSHTCGVLGDGSLLCW